MLASSSICFLKGKDLGKGKKEKLPIIVYAAIKVLCLRLRPHKPHVNNEDRAYLKCSNLIEKFTHLFCILKRCAFVSYLVIAYYLQLHC